MLFMRQSDMLEFLQANISPTEIKFINLNDRADEMRDFLLRTPPSINTYFCRAALAIFFSFPHDFSKAENSIASQPWVSFMVECAQTYFQTNPPLVESLTAYFTQFNLSIESLDNIDTKLEVFLKTFQQPAVTSQGECSDSDLDDELSGSSGVKTVINYYSYNLDITPIDQKQENGGLKRSTSRVRSLHLAGDSLYVEHQEITKTTFKNEEEEKDTGNSTKKQKMTN